MKNGVFYCIRRIVIAVLLLLALLLLFFKYAEEMVNLKSDIYYLIRSPKADTKVDFSDYPVVTHSGNEWYQSSRLILHAGGGIDGLDYTNSREALENTLNSGNFLVEIDFEWTSDDVLVCMHEWEDQWGGDNPYGV